MDSGTDIGTDRLVLVVLDLPTLESISTGLPCERFQRPEWWPDDADRAHVEFWLQQASRSDAPPAEWGPRAMTLDGQMIGHCGLQGTPVNIDVALADPSYEGPTEAATAGVVEFGYTVLEDHRGNGYATEASAGLIEWARSTGRVSTVIATVRPDNVSSVRVLQRLGGFRRTGTCRDEAGALEDVYRLDL